MTDLQVGGTTGAPSGPDGEFLTVDPTVSATEAVRSRAAIAQERRPKATRVVAARISVWRRFSELWRWRELLIFLVRKEIAVKYKNSFLGFLWSMINPAMTLAVFYFVFAVIAKNGIPDFVIFLFSGLLAWNIFQTGVLTATSVVVANAGIVKKVAFPREILALAAVGTALFFFFFQSIVMVLLLVALHSAPAWGYLWLLIPALLAMVVFASALAVFFSAVNVFLRDTQHLVEILVGAVWFWSVPIVYAYGPLAARLRHAFHHAVNPITNAAVGGVNLEWLLFLNPLTPIALTFQRVLYGHPVAFSDLSSPGKTPGSVVHTSLTLLPLHGPLWYLGLDGIVFGGACVLFVGALAMFGRLEGNFAEEL